jgi:rubrerythrin
MVHEDLTPLEAVALAVRSEIESTNLYGKVIERVRNPEVIKMLEEMAAEEEHHRDALLELYREMLGGQDPSVPITDGRMKDKKLDEGEMWDIDPNADFLTIMTKARDKELDSEEFYKSAAESVRDHKTRMFFIELAETEKKHAIRLQKEVDKLEQDPDWFEREELEGFKPVHEGP